MRENLYRGTRKANGEWVKGDLIKCKDKCYIHPNANIFQVHNALSKLIVLYEVIPETVGQYTGLNDKNGEKIFEGDIIKVTTLDTGDERRAIIGFGNFIDENNDDEYIGFYIEFEGIKATITQLAMEEVKDRFEVIGNKWDTPELLKGE